MRRAGLSLVAAGTAAVIAGYTAWMLKPASAPSLPLARFTITLPTDQQFSNPGRHLVALSPDGTHIVYVANARLYLRAMDQLEAVPIRGTEGTGNMAGRSPFFSPDGQWIGFWQDGQLKKVSITGGSPVVLCAAQNPWGASWATDNTILYGQGADGIWRVSGNGGKPENVVRSTPARSPTVRNCCPGGAPSCLRWPAATSTGTPRRSSSSRSTPVYVASSSKAAQTRGMCQPAISCTRLGARCWGCRLTRRHSR